MPRNHYSDVKLFMEKARHNTPIEPTIPSEEIRKLRASLILEETIETINALGFQLLGNDGKEISTLYLLPNLEPDIVEIIDGCCDLKVVTTGTLIACGIEDEPFQLIVDESNLKKVEDDVRFREDGKIMKPDDWKPPTEEIKNKLNKLGYNGH